MADQLSLRLEADGLPDLPDLRPMLPRPLPAPFDSAEHLFEPWWGGERALVAVGPSGRAGRRRRASSATRRARDVTRGAARAGRAGGPGRGAVGDPRWRAGRRRRGRRADHAELGRRLAGEPGRPVAFLAFDLLHLDGRSLLRSRWSVGARRSGACCGRATRSWRCRRSRRRGSPCSKRPSPRGSPGSSPVSARARTCRASAAGCGGSSPRGPGPRRCRGASGRWGVGRPSAAAAPVLALISRLPLDED